MGGFCKHCGKELSGDEPYCPECGMPTGTGQPQAVYAPPKGNGTKIAVLIVVAIAVLCIIGIAMLPVLVNTTTSEKYTMTVTVNDFAIYLDDPTQYTDIASHCEVILSLTYKYEGETAFEEIELSKNYAMNSGITPSAAKSSVKITGDPKDVKVTAFLLIRGFGWSYDDKAFYDYIDIYSVDKSRITSGGSLYYGDSGIVFSMEDLDEDGRLKISGDSDPKGIIDVTVTTVKIQ